MKGSKISSETEAVAALRYRVREKQAVIVIIGLGYVGIPVAASFAAAGFQVIGYDLNRTRVDAVEAGLLPIASKEPELSALVESVVKSGRLRATTDSECLEGADVCILAVDTPIDADRKPDSTHLVRACETVAQFASGPLLVSVESTVAPGTMAEVVAPILTRVPMSFLVHCPERVRPGRLLHNLRTMNRLVGAPRPSLAELGRELYAHVVSGHLTIVSWETAEVVKTAENAARDVQIALANQLAVICDYNGVDVRSVRKHINELWASEPLILEPGPGVGGYCLPKDPWLLISRLPSTAPSELVRGSRAVNDHMPSHVVELMRRMLRTAGVATGEARVAVLGMTYDSDSDDTRNAPGPRIAAGLAECVAEVRTHDPYISGKDIETVLRGADGVVLAVAHTAYRTTDFGSLGTLMRTRLFLDCRRVLDGDRLTNAGYIYRALGVGVPGS